MACREWVEEFTNGVNTCVGVEMWGDIYMSNLMEPEREGTTAFLLYENRVTANNYMNFP